MNRFVLRGEPGSKFRAVEVVLLAIAALSALALLTLALAGCSGTPTTGDGGGPAAPEHALSAVSAPDRLWVKGKTPAEAFTAMQAASAVLGTQYSFGTGSPEIVPQPELMKLGYVLIDAGVADPEVLLGKLRGTKGIAGAGYDGVARLIAPVLGVEAGARVTLDPLVGSQWMHEKLGSVAAWDAGYSGASVVVGIADTGVQCDHPDLRCHGPGRDFTGGSAPTDRFGHGTHVAGDCCAKGSNGQGGSGIASGAEVLAAKVLGDDGSGLYSGIAAGIVYLVDNGAKVVNLSLGGSTGSPMMQDALRYGVGKGVLFACAAGNEGTSSLTYPNAYPECIGVAATLKDGEGGTSWTNWGGNADVGAPGESIMSTCITSRYCQMSGTSMASPVFAGVLALVLGAGVKSGDALALVNSTGTLLTGRLAGLKRPNIRSLVAALQTRPTLTPPPTPTVPSATPPKMTTITPPPTRTVRPGPTDTPGTLPPLWNCSAISDTNTSIIVRCVQQPQ